MKESTTAPVVPTRTDGTVGDLPFRNAERNPTRVAFSRRTGSGWSDVSAAAFRDEVLALAKGLIATGVAPGDAVAIMSKTRYEWTLVDCALWAVGAVPVPIYETSSAEQVQWILQDSGAVGAVVETPAHRDTVQDVRGAAPGFVHLWVVDEGGLDALTASGGAVDDEAVTAARAGLDRSSPATLIYTSGTTGRPKGVQLTHGNFLDTAENSAERLAAVVRAPGASTLLFLPLAHVFARFIEVLCLEAQATMGHSADIRNLLGDLAAFKPTFVLAVPRVFEKIYNATEAKAVASGRGKIFQSAAETAIAWSEARDEGGPPLRLRVKHTFFDRLVYGQLRAALGNRIAFAVSGGAPLGTRLGHFYRGVGICILEGYGLTETTAPSTVNLPDRMRIGTVGVPLPGTAIAIADDGEVLIKGVNVFGGYHGNPEASADALKGDWFYTGDIGELDDDGFLRITGRKKEILVTAGGKNVAPAVLEDRLRAHPLISQCIVVGDQKPFIAVLLTLDEEMVPAWTSNHGLKGLTAEQARTDPTVLAALQEAVDDANKAVSKAESIRKFVVLDTDFTEQSGHLTPSLKLKRNVIMRDYADEVEALYGG